MPRITPGPPCVICKKPSVARQFCSLHYERWNATGDPLGTKRPNDWGARRKHQLYDTWRGTIKMHPGRVAEWDDFWAFIADVGDRPPDTDYSLRRRDSEKPFGPENCYWAQRSGSAGSREQHAKYMRSYRSRHKSQAKGHYLKKSYGITLQDYDDMLSAQLSSCAICGCVPDNFALAVDHCHKTKAIRGLLCTNCNRGLGHFEDSPKRLRSAAAYLLKHERSGLKD